MQSVPIEDHYADFFGAIAEIAPGLVHLHYGVASSVPRVPWLALRELARGPVALLDDAIRAAELHTLARGARGLDLGCGLAGTSMELARRLGLRMTGLDRTGAQLARARTRLTRRGLADQVRLAQGNGVALPFASSSFALAASIEMVFHVADKESLFAEVARVLAPAGTWLLVDQENRDPANAVAELFHFAAPGDIPRLAQAAGLELVREVDLSARVASWMTLYAAMASPPAQAALVPVALWRGGPALARRYLRGIRTYERLVLENAQRCGLADPKARARGAIRAVRLHTKRCLEDGRAAYKVWVLRKPAT